LEKYDRQCGAAALSAKLVLLRHGQSIWNRADRFTGWTDVELTEQGVDEARRAGRLLKDAGIAFDIAFTSLLRRAIQTLWIVLAETELEWLPIVKDWHLNERHYGALQGLVKTDTAERVGQEIVFEMRRSYTAVPPALALDDPRHARFDRRYAGIDPAQLPAAESLKDTMDRVLLCWNDAIQPRLAAGQQVLIAAHGNSLRALIKHLDQVADEDVPAIYIPNGFPLVYTFHEDLTVEQRTYLGESKKLKAAIKMGRLRRPE
jgi:2,3-bisphosphoglycerate-dependent phosphoglycerate mutase